VVLMTLGVGAGALVATRFVKSPAQVAAEAAPPATGPVTVPVERRVMRSTLVTRGQVGAARSVAIQATSAGEGGKPIVTRLPVGVGESVRAGQVVAEVSGRPIIVMPGEVPAYRDLRPSAEGADVAQLQTALQAMGHKTGADAKGVYGAGTKSAVAAVYAAAGYPVPTTGKDDPQQLLAAQRRVRDANAAHDRLKRTPPPADEAGGSAHAQAIADAKQAANDAQQDLADLIAHTGPMVPMGELVFVASLPARVESTATQVGANPQDTLLTLAVGDLVVRSAVPRADGPLVRAGQPVEIVSEILGLTAQGQVSAIGPPAPRPVAGRGDPGAESGGGSQSQDGTESGGAPPDGSPVAQGDLELTVQGRSVLDSRLAGQDVRLTIESASTTGEVLVVPLAAVSARGDGQAQVVRIDGHGREERCVVTPGVSGDGYVQVTPVSGGLNAGDRVVVGR